MQISLISLLIDKHAKKPGHHALPYYQGVVLIQIELRIVRSSTRTLYGFSQPQISLSNYLCIRRLLNGELSVHSFSTA